MELANTRSDIEDNNTSNRRETFEPHNYTFHPSGESTIQSDKEKIISGDTPVKTKRKKKKRKNHEKSEKMDLAMNDPQGNNTDTTASVEHLGNEKSGDSIRLERLESTEKLWKIKENLHEGEPEAVEGQKDLRELALQLAMRRSDEKNQEKTWHYDYALVHRTGDNNNTHERLRETFEKALSEEGFKIEKKYTTERTFVVLHCPFERLCVEAEHVSLQMPLAGYVVPQAGVRSCMTKFWDKFKTDTDVDFISAQFCVSKKSIYEGIDNPDTFFRPALRSLLVHHILSNIDIRNKESRQLGQNRQGLPFLLLEKAYSDAFILHEKSKLDAKFPMPDAGDDGSFLRGQDIADPRKFLHHTWLKWLKFQPLWKIRNYFGEKIALYFAWLGTLSFSLVIPVLLGMAIFFWGLFVATVEWSGAPFLLSVGENPIGHQNATISSVIGKWAKKAFDNNATPYFALIICLWGTIFLELWKRTNARLAYQWDVDVFEEQEPNRSQFYGTRIKPDPVTGQEEAYYPFLRRCLKMSGSFSLLLFMVCLVLASLFAVIVYRIIAREDYFNNQGISGTTIASVTSTFINTCSIMIMGKVYQVLAVKLTDWENHRTQTLYEDALIIKLFGFQFVNSYTSLFYIAFFRQRTASEGILGFGSQYNDACGANNDCMTLLSLQVAMLMVMKPLPKLLTDIILPWLKRVWRQGFCCCNNKVEEAGEVQHEVEDFLNYELQKEPSSDFTLSEYTEKVLQYGFLMLFAAAFPLAPLIALLTNLIDMKIDARRLLWVNRRPIAYRAGDIGMWYGILEFLNVVGVVTNGFLVTFTSDYGKNWEGVTTISIKNETVYDPNTNFTFIQTTIVQHATFSRLWLLIGFEHVVFSIKFLIAWLIQDTPGDVRLAQRREKYHVADILAKAGIRKGPGKKLAESSSTRRRPPRTSQSSPLILVGGNPPGVQLTPRGTRSSHEVDTSASRDELERVVVETPPQTPETVSRRPRVTPRTQLNPLPVSYRPKLNSQMARNELV